MNFTRSQQVRIVIADDHPIFRDGLRRLLEAEAELNVAGEAADGAQAVKLGRQLKPDILLLDLAMPKQTGLEALRELSVPANSSLVRVILLTAAIEKVQILQALQLGARGIVLKESATQMLFEAIERVMAGEYWVHRKGCQTWLSIYGRSCNRRPMNRVRKHMASRPVNYRSFPQ